MSSADQIYSSKIKYIGIFDFKDFYAFCYEWLSNEVPLIVAELDYQERIKGAAKELIIKWEGYNKVSDYFAFKVQVEFKLLGLTDIEINQGGKKIKTNQGEVGMKIKGFLVKDYEGRFEKSARSEFWKGVYEKWIIVQRVKQFEDKLAEKCDVFLGQAKAFLDLAGKSRH